MNYGRLRPSDPGSSEYFDPPSSHHRPGRTLRLVIVLLLSLALLLASAFSATILVLARLRPQPKLSRPPARALSRACGQTRHPNVCLDWLNDYPGAESASEQDLVHISFNVTLQRLSRALYFTSEISGLPMSPRERSAYEDCLELLDGSVDALHRSLFTVVNNKASGSGSTQDVMTWLSAALTNQDTCAEGFADVGAGGEVKQRVAERVKDLSKMLSNCLAIYAAAAGEDFAGVPIQNRRLMGHDDDVVSGEGSFPRWMSREERRLMDTPPAAIKPDVVVSQDGNGTCKTIAEAIKKVPDYFGRRFIIYVRAGRYEEPNLKVGRKKTNVMFVGDGKVNTIISGCKSIFDNMTTFHTASFAASGAGFIARDITFQNWAGPEKHQAVALRVGADHAVVYRCNIIGYQDTLYVHSNRQFFRECDIYGTVDFIFGNAAVVLQNCSLFARKPMPMQKNTITAQNRKDPNQNTGISIHACRILAHTDLMASNGSFLTFLGRPWKLYSRTVYMMSYIGNHIHPRGWLEWNATFALDTLYYGEYMNYGPGGATGQRVQWPGYRVITSPEEASKFTVGQFIFGSSWLPSTGVAFLAGLSV